MSTVAAAGSSAWPTTREATTHSNSVTAVVHFMKFLPASLSSTPARRDARVRVPLRGLILTLQFHYFRNDLKRSG